MENITQQQLEANRKNAQLGGVKTEEGKEVSKMNAIKHGILSKNIILDDEDKECFENLQDEIYEALSPQGFLEKLLVDRIVSNYWRLKRIINIEKSLISLKKEPNHFDNRGLGYDNPEEMVKHQNNINIIDSNQIDKLLRYEVSIEKSIYKAFNMLMTIQSKNGFVS